MILQPDDVVKSIEKIIGSDLTGHEVRVRHDGYRNRTVQKHLYLYIERDSFHMAVSILRKISPVHVSCPIASREGDGVLELIYSFMIYSGRGNFSELPVIITVPLPADDLTLRSCCDIIPGIIIMEREAQEMLGVLIEDIPDRRKFFTPGNLPSGTYPLRKKTAKAGVEAGADE